MEETKNRSEKNLCCEVDYYLYRFRLGRTLCSKMFCLGVFFAVFFNCSIFIHPHHTCRFQITNIVLISDKDNTRKYKM